MTEENKEVNEKILIPKAGAKVTKDYKKENEPIPFFDMDMKSIINPIVDNTKKEQQNKNYYEMKQQLEGMKKFIPAFIGIFVILLIVISGFKQLRYHADYKQAVNLWEAGKYEEANGAFIALNGYADSEVYASKCIDKINELKYQQAVGLWEDEKYEEAKDAFSALDGYGDSEDYVSKCIDKIRELTYEQATLMMEQGEYEQAVEELYQISNYKDATEKIIECENHLHSKLAGIWHGSSDDILTLYEDGSCYYDFGYSGEGEGTWNIDENWLISIDTNVTLVYEIYAFLDNRYKTTSMQMVSKRDASYNETYTKVTDFDVNSEDIVKLVGTWNSATGKKLTLNEDGTCYYVSSWDECNGTWSVDEHARININIPGLPVFSHSRIYALLRDGYNTSSMNITEYGAAFLWTEEVYTKAQ